jgi:hypothetical protein
MQGFVDVEDGVDGFQRFDLGGEYGGSLLVSRVSRDLRGPAVVRCCPAVGGCASLLACSVITRAAKGQGDGEVMPPSSGETVSMVIGSSPRCEGSPVAHRRGWCCCVHGRRWYWGW